MKSKVIKFADEAAFKPDPLVFDGISVSADFILR